MSARPEFGVFEDTPSMRILIPSQVSASESANGSVTPRSSSVSRRQSGTSTFSLKSSNLPAQAPPPSGQGFVHLWTPHTGDHWPAPGSPHQGSTGRWAGGFLELGRSDSQWIQAGPPSLQPLAPSAPRRTSLSSRYEAAQLGPPSAPAEPHRPSIWPGKSTPRPFSQLPLQGSG